MNHRTKRSYWVALAALAIFLLLVGSEMVIRLLSESSPKYGFTPHFPYMPDSLVGWRHIPSSRFLYETAEFEVWFPINSEGFRSTDEYVTADGRRRVIAVLGDSFVQAIQVNENETFTELLESRLRDTGIYQVQNYGVSNTGVVHYLQLYRHYARIHRPELVIVCILDQNDIFNSSYELTPALRPVYSYGDDGAIEEIETFEELIVGKARPTNLRSYLKKNWALYRFLGRLRSRLAPAKGTTGRLPASAFVYEDPWNESFREAWRHAEWALQELVEAIRADGATPLIVLMPGKWTTSDETWEDLAGRYRGEGRLDRARVRRVLREAAAALQVDYLDLTDILTAAYREGSTPHWDRDSHMTPSGHRLVADAIEEMLMAGYFSRTIFREELPSGDSSRQK
jgi:lysophospholipase L1-like esterase